MTVPLDSEYVLEVAGLTRRYGAKAALDDIWLKVPRGAVFGLVGENGAGKTTLIKHLMGLLKPQFGSVRVFGRDPVIDPEGALSRIGYLSEDRSMPLWMSVTELMGYTRAFYPKWDQTFADELRETFALDPKAKVRHLSRGERAKLGLLLALAHRPELLILDEPSSGLDLAVRRHILTAIIQTVAEEGRTVLFSSHLLDEVDRVADYVTMINQGQIVLSSTMDEAKEAHHRITLRFAESQRRMPSLPGALFCEGSGQEWSVVCNGRLEELKKAAESAGAEILAEQIPSLEDIFLAHASNAPRAAKEED
ncbi:MAG: ABC transporter ATP-binding protein [Candidatus Hydrogenedentes bacterium]|nr:ABC transporter ATP-binding protein [Candidatus Hydrogenedentota bacterium]